MYKRLICLILLVVSAGLHSKAQSVSAADEYNLKAAFIYNFTRYFEWKSAEPSKDFIIGIVGSSPVSESLEEIASTKTVDGKKIVIRKFNSPEDITYSHILFISKNTDFPLWEILAKAPDKGTLIVSEKAGCAEQGTAINFIITDNKLKFEANTKSINLAGLKASSQLLKLAILVNQN